MPASAGGAQTAGNAQARGVRKPPRYLRVPASTPRVHSDRCTLMTTMETLEASVQSPPRPMPGMEQHRILARPLDPPSDRAVRVVRFGRLTLAAFRAIAVGLAVLGSVLAWLLIVPLVDLVTSSVAQLGRLLGIHRLR